MRTSITLLFIFLITASNAFSKTLLESGSSVSIWPIVIISLVILFIYSRFLPTLRKKFPKVFKTPVTSGNDVVGKDETGKDITLNNAIGIDSLSIAIDNMDKGNNSRALSYLDEAIGYGVNDAYTIRATCLASLDFYLDAVDDLNKAVSFDPENPELYFLRASYRTNTGEYEGALADRQKTFQIIEMDTEINRKKNIQAKSDGYASLKNKYEDFYSELEQEKPALAAKGFNLQRRKLQS